MILRKEFHFLKIFFFKLSYYFKWDNKNLKIILVVQFTKINSQHLSPLKINLNKITKCLPSFIYIFFGLQAELDIVKKERELALAKVRQLKDENETIRIYYR